MLLEVFGISNPNPNPTSLELDLCSNKLMYSNKANLS